MRGRLRIEPRIDPFRERQVPDVAGRFLRYRDGHQRQADLMWLGALVQFSDHELRLLDDLGYLSQRDRDLLRHAAARAARSDEGEAVSPEPDLTSELDAAEDIVTGRAEVIVTEYGARRPDLASGVFNAGSDEDAERLARLLAADQERRGITGALVRRTVTYGPWEDAGEDEEHGGHPV